MDVQTAYEIMAEAAEANAFLYKANDGETDLTFKVSVRLEKGGDVILSAECNAQISQDRCVEELCKVWRSVFAREDVKGCFRGNKRWMRFGFEHMGRFHTGGFYRRFRASA